MITQIISILKDLPKEIIVTIVAALPISEVRGSIPVGVAMGLPMFKVFWFSLLGNLIPVIPLLLFLEPISNNLRRFRIWKNFFDWLFERTKKKADLIEKYESLGLMLFVAVPLPMTGAWTGCIAASLFKIRFKYALLAISAGVLIAACIVTAVVLAGKSIF